jgi:hypothetical protein
MEAMVYRNIFAFLLIASGIVLVRMKQEEAEREIDGLRRLAHA